MVILSVVISAFNEEAKIGECLESVRQLADEIIFVDNESTDKTVAIAKKYTSKIFTRPNNPMLNVNKNFGFTKATGDWILSLDADERVTHELTKEILETIQQFNNSTINGFWIPRKNIIFGKLIKHSGWYPDHQLRLFRRGKGKFPALHVHEMVEVEGKTVYLKEHITHYNYETIDQFLGKLSHIYAPNEARELLRKGYRLDWLDAVRFPTKEFLSRFFAQEGYKDGLHGLMLSLLMAFYHLVVFAKVWEVEKFGQETAPDFLSDLQKETEKGYKGLLFWFTRAKAEKTRNPAKKMLYRVLLRMRR